MNRILATLVRRLLFQTGFKAIRRLATWWGDKGAEDLPPEQAKQAKAQSRKNAKSATRLAGMIRRFGRF